MSLVDNERTRLLANALDRASTACFTVGILTPGAAYLYDLAGIRGMLDTGAALIGMLSWMLAVIALHLFSRRVLKELRA